MHDEQARVPLIVPITRTRRRSDDRIRTKDRQFTDVFPKLDVGRIGGGSETLQEVLLSSSFALEWGVTNLILLTTNLLLRHLSKITS